MEHSGWLWAVGTSGVPKKLACDETPIERRWVRHPVTPSSESPVLRVAVSPRSAFSVTRDGRFWVFVHRSAVVPTRAVFTYSNQRWYPAVGWCSWTLPTDRRSFSDADGEKELPFSAFELPSKAWGWLEPWSIWRSRSHCDAQGWEYAFNFSHAWGPSKLSSFVRRRAFRRLMQYTAIESWIQVEDRKPAKLVDIATGGWQDQTAASSSLECSIWALDENGNLLLREGASDEEPGGRSWQRVDAPSALLLAVHCAPTAPGQLVVVCCDGNILLRVGQTVSNVRGTGWMGVAGPGGAPVAWLSAAAHSCWMGTADARVWELRPDTSAATGRPQRLQSAWNSARCVQVFSDGCRVFPACGEQLLCVDATNALCIRADIDPDKERLGTHWRTIVAPDPQADGFVQVDASLCDLTNHGVPTFWYDSPMSNGRSAKKPFSEEAEWRELLVDSLMHASRRSWLVWGEMKPPWEDEQLISTEEAATLNKQSTENEWKRETRVQLVGDSAPPQSARSASSSTAILLLLCEKDQLARLNLHSSGRVIFEIDIHQLVAVISLSPQGSSATSDVLFRIYTTANAIQHVTVGFSELAERSRWLEAIQTEQQKAMECSPTVEGELRTMWLLLNSHQLYMVPCNLAAVDDTEELLTRKISRSPWLAVPSNFKQLTVGEGHVVWALATDGGVWRLSSALGSAASLGSLPKHSFFIRDTLRVHETAQYKILRGFRSWDGLMDGQLSWSDANSSGDVPATLEARLEAGWKWINERWLLETDDEEAKSNEGWSFSASASGPFSRSTAAGSRFRRRTWRRTRELRIEAPWQRVAAPSSLERVIVSKQGSVVFGITTQGQVLMRSSPTAVVWKHLFCFTEPIKRLTAWRPDQLVLLTEDNRLLCCVSDDAPTYEPRNFTTRGLGYLSPEGQLPASIEHSSSSQIPRLIAAAEHCVWVVYSSHLLAVPYGDESAKRPALCLSTGGLQITDIDVSAKGRLCILARPANLPKSQPAVFVQCSDFSIDQELAQLQQQQHGWLRRSKSTPQVERDMVQTLDLRMLASNPLISFASASVF